MVENITEEQIVNIIRNEENGAGYHIVAAMLDKPYKWVQKKYAHV